MVQEGAFEGCCALNVSFASRCWLSPRPASPILDGFPLGAIRTFRSQTGFSQAKNDGSSNATSYPGSMDGKNLASLVSPYKADPLI